MKKELKIEMKIVSMVSVDHAIMAVEETGTVWVLEDIWNEETQEYEYEWQKHSQIGENQTL